MASSRYLFIIGGAALIANLLALVGEHRQLRQVFADGIGSSYGGGGGGNSGGNGTVVCPGSPDNADSAAAQATLDKRDPYYVHAPGFHLPNRPNKSSASPPPPPNFTHYLLHTPKTGGIYARSTLIAYSKHYNGQLARKLPARGLSGRNSTAAAEAMNLCDMGTRPVEQWRSWPSHYRHEKTGYVFWRCGMYMSESHYPFPVASPTDNPAAAYDPGDDNPTAADLKTENLPPHVYALLRHPRQHVLSQYIHCTESKPHARKAKFMPTLDQWLEGWSILVEAGRTLDEVGRVTVNVSGLYLRDGGVGYGRKNETMIRNVTSHRDLINLRKRYRCFNPVDMQSILLGFGPSTPMEQITKENLRRRLDVAGITSKMERSLCLIFIRWRGTVPRKCRCGERPREGARQRDGDATAGTDSDNNNNNNSDGKGGAGRVAAAASDLAAVHGSRLYSHGVTNHGSTYNATTRQLEAIDKLTVRDRRLYGAALELFEEEVGRVEDEYGIVLC